MWVEHALNLIEKTDLTTDDAIGLGAYHASIQPPTRDIPALRALLPLFYEKAATPAMIKHGIDIQKQEKNI